MVSRRSQSGESPSGLQRLIDLSLSGSGLHLVDAAIASSSNFLLGVLVASRVSTEDFGRFGAAFALYSMTFGVWRAFGADAFLLSRSKTPNDVGSSISASAWLGLLFGVVGAIIAVLIGSEDITQRFLAVFAIGLPILAIQDAVRYVLVGIGRTVLAIAMNLVWLTLLATTMWFDVGAIDIAVVWIVAASVSAVTGMSFLRWPRLSGGVAWIRSHFTDCAKFAMEFWINSVSLLIVFFAIGLFSGLAEMGAYRAAAVLIGPVAVVSNGLMTTAQLLDPASFGPNELRRRVELLVGTGVSAGLVTAALIVALPDSLGSLLLGESWATAQPVGVALAISFGALAALMATIGTLRALGRPTQGYRYRVGGLVLVGVGGTAGAFHSALAAAIGMAICGFIAMGIALRGVWPHLTTDRELASSGV